jgi:hypothetical protein
VRHRIYRSGKEHPQQFAFAGACFITRMPGHHYAEKFHLGIELAISRAIPKNGVLLNIINGA